MAARRGLNKGRGLGSLIPQKIKSENEDNSVEREATELEGAAKTVGANAGTGKKTGKSTKKTDIKSVFCFFYFSSGVFSTLSPSFFLAAIHPASANTLIISL